MQTCIVTLSLYNSILSQFIIFPCQRTSASCHVLFYRLSNLNTLCQLSYVLAQLKQRYCAINIIECTKNLILSEKFNLLTD